MKTKYWLILTTSVFICFGALLFWSELKVYFFLTDKVRYWQESSYDISAMKLKPTAYYRFNTNLTYEKYYLRSDGVTMAKSSKKNKPFRVWNEKIFIDPIKANGQSIMDGQPIIYTSKDSIVILGIGKNVWANHLNDSTFNGKNQLFKRLVFLTPFDFSGFKIIEPESAH